MPTTTGVACGSSLPTNLRLGTISPRSLDLTCCSVCAWTGPYFSQSDDGPICLEVEGLVSIYNPSTGKHAAFGLPGTRVRSAPWSYFEQMHCFGYDPVERKHKVLSTRVISKGRLDRTDILEPRVLTLGAKRWRWVEGCAPHYKKDHEFCFGGVVYYTAWSSSHDCNGDMHSVAFDVRTESFRMIMVPARAREFRHKGLLIEFEGCLAIVNCYTALTCAEFYMWILEDFDQEIWILSTVLTCAEFYMWILEDFNQEIWILSTRVISKGRLNRTDILEPRVLTLGTKRWRQVEGYAPHYKKDHEFCFGGVVYYTAWSSSRDCSGDMYPVAFDVRTESFRMIMVPAKAREFRHKGLLIEFEGCLAIVDCYTALTCAEFYMWILEDFDQEIWILSTRVISKGRLDRTDILEPRVLTLGIKRWRRVEGCVPHYKKDHEFYFGGVVYYTAWSSSRDCSGDMYPVAFNVRTESFRMIMVPARARKFKHKGLLIEFEGCLAIVDCYTALTCAEFYMWILEDFDQEIWKKRVFVLPAC